MSLLSGGGHFGRVSGQPSGSRQTRSWGLRGELRSKDLNRYKKLIDTLGIRK